MPRTAVALRFLFSTSLMMPQDFKWRVVLVSFKALLHRVWFSDTLQVFGALGQVCRIRCRWIVERSILPTSLIFSRPSELSKKSYLWEAPWKGGKCEKAGGLWKDLWRKTVLEVSVSGRRPSGNLHCQAGSQLFPSFQRLCSYPMGSWSTRSSIIPGALLDE